MNNEIALAVLREIEALVCEKGSALIAIDGRCGSGKTTLAKEIQSLRKCEIIHMDHFYPRLAQRTAERLSEPGGNVDRERFLEEVMLPLVRREAFSYRPYNPVIHGFSDAIKIEPSELTIIEGSYSCHPTFFDSYDLRIFLTVDMPERLRRIKERNGEDGLIQFQERWIPMEERYFSAFGIQERCNLRFSTG